MANVPASDERPATGPTPLTLVLQSVRNPVTDEQALADSVRMTLGQEPEGRSAMHTPHAEPADGANRSFAAAVGNPINNNSMSASGFEVVVLPTRSYSGIRELSRPPSRALSRAPSGTIDRTPLLPPAVSDDGDPHTFAAAAAAAGDGDDGTGDDHASSDDHGSSGGGDGEDVDAEGEPYVFRYNIRVTELPTPTLEVADPKLLEAINNSAAYGGAGAPVSSSGSSSSDSSSSGDRGGLGGPAGRHHCGQHGRDASVPSGAGANAHPASGGPAAFSPASHDAPVFSSSHEPLNSGTGSDSNGVANSRDAAVSHPTEPLATDDDADGGSAVVLFSATDEEAAAAATTQRRRGRAGAKKAVPNAHTPLEFETHTYLTTGAFHAQPILMDDVQRERIIVDCFNALSSERRRLELLEAFYTAYMAPFEAHSEFTGDDWDDLMAKERSRKWFDLTFDDARYCFYVTLFHRVHRVFLFSFLLRCFCLFLFWVIMFCLVKPYWFYPGGMFFDTFTTILFAGVAGSVVARILTIPTLIGVIWAGILWNNVPYTGRLTAGITLEIRQFISYFGLSIGLIRAGLSLNVIRFKQKFKHYIVFSLLPMAGEAMVHGVCCKYIYHYPNYRWAFAEGFLLSSIAPSVVVPIIIAYQRRGYGVRDGPPMMMLCSIAVDTAICIWGVQFLLALEFKAMSTALLIVLAPVQVLVGLVGGVILGLLVFVVVFYVLFMEAERLPSVRTDRLMTVRHSVHVRYLSIFFMTLITFTCMAVGRRFSCTGGAAVGAVTVASTFNYLCVRGGSRDHLRVKADMAQTLTTIWDYIAMPALFGLSGAAVNVHELFARDFIGQAFGLVFIGIGVRALCAMLAPTITRLGLSWREVVFCGIGWIGKGSVQGSLGGSAQLYAQAELAHATTPAEVALAESRIKLGIKMKNTAILGILVACPLCSIFLTRFTSKLLKKDA